MKQLTQDNEDQFQPIGMAADRLMLNLIKSRKLPEVFGSADVVSDGSLDRRSKRTEINGTAILDDAGDKSGSALIEINALESSGGSYGVFIGVVLLAARQSEISESVVIPSTIDMVDQLRRPLPHTVEPRKPSGLVEKAIYADDPVAMNAMETTRDRANAGNSRCILGPSENARIWVIAKNLPKAFGRQSTGSNFVWHVLQPKETSDPKAGEPETNPKDDRKTDPDEQRAYIDEGLRRMRRFELPYRSGGKRNDAR